MLPDSDNEIEESEQSARFELALRQFRNFKSSIQELLGDIERAIADGRIGAAGLRSTVDRQTTDRPLPLAALKEIERRLEPFLDDSGVSRLPLAPDERNVGESGAGAHRALTIESENQFLGEHKTLNALNDRYELIKPLDSGTRNTVYKALDRQKVLDGDPNPFVTVKILESRWSSRELPLDKLEDAAAWYKLLSHPNILKVFAILRDDTTVYMIMEYPCGTLLTQEIAHIRNRRMPPDKSLQIISAAGNALAYLHARGISNCDFKPANVLLTSNGGVKLIDFGITRRIRLGQALRPDSEAELPAHDVEAAAFARSDIINDRLPDPRDDVYALACMAYELLTGLHRFAGQPPTEGMETSRTVRFRRGLSRRQWKAIKRGLAGDRDQRRPSVTQFLKELEERRFGVITISAAASITALLMVGVSVAFLYLLGKPRAPLSEMTEMAEKPPASTSNTIPAAPDQGTALATRAFSPEISTALSASAAGAAKAPPPTGRVHVDSTESRDTRNVPYSAATTSLSSYEGYAFASRAVAEAEQGINATEGTSGKQRLTLQSVQKDAVKTQDPEKRLRSAATVAQGGRELEKLYAEAQRQLAEQRLTRPAGANAWETFRHIIRINPNDQRAYAGLKTIAGRLETVANAQRNRGNLRESLLTAEEGLGVLPTHVGLRAMHRDLSQRIAAQPQHPNE
jgi:serine/threonine protein kinase